MNCNQCEFLFVNGLGCHETGCPDAWKSRSKSCFECGCNFSPETRFESVCFDCLNPIEFNEETES
jgi:hypothetical protein